MLVPACSRPVEPKMNVKTDSERVRLSRKLVLEFLGSSVDLSCASPRGPRLDGALRRGSRALRPARAAGRGRSSATRPMPGHHHARRVGRAATVAQPVKIDNELYVRDYAKCILCYKCVQACGVEAQNTFAIAVAGRGFDARISTEFATPLPESACVYCGNCIGVCPTGALMFKSEHDMRAGGTWDESRQTVTDTICPYCGVGCTLAAARAGQRDRPRHLAARPRRHERPPLHQGPLRLAVRPEPAEGVGRCGRSCGRLLGIAAEAPAPLPPPPAGPNYKAAWDAAATTGAEDAILTGRIRRLLRVRRREGRGHRSPIPAWRRGGAQHRLRRRPRRALPRAGRPGALGGRRERRDDPSRAASGSRDSPTSTCARSATASSSPPSRTIGSISSFPSSCCSTSRRRTPTCTCATPSAS